MSWATAAPIGSCRCCEGRRSRVAAGSTGAGATILPTASALALATDKEPPLATVFLIHDRLATTVLLFMAAVGIWGLLSYLRGEGLGGSLSGALVIGQALVVTQGLFGAILYFDGARPSTSVHLLYGVTAAIVLPFVWSYMRNRDPRQALLFYSLVALFVAGLAIRGMTTGT